MSKTLRRLIFFGLLFGLVACSVPSQPTANRSPKIEKDDSRLRKVADLPDPQLGSYTLDCVSPSVCWIGDHLKQWRTDDGGQHWQLIYSGNPFESEIRTIDYVDERMAWMTTLNNLYKTEDGGRNWIEQVSPIPSSRLGEVTGVKYLQDGKTGWVTGGIYGPLTRDEQLSGVPRNMSDPPSNRVLRPAISRTLDGGNTWIRQSIPSTLGRVYVPTFLDQRHGVTFGDSAVFYTTSGGEQWNRVEFKKSCTNGKYLQGYDMNPLDIFFLDSGNAWLSFEDGRITRSTDGGKSWCDLLEASDNKVDSDGKSFKEIHFADLNNGMGLAAAGFLYETKDGGKTWVQASTIKFDDWSFPDNHTCLIVSKVGLFKLSLSQE